MSTSTGAAGLVRAAHKTFNVQISSEHAALLRRAFPGVDESSLGILAGMTRERSVPAGVLLCTEGQVENTFYLICSGRVLISQHMEGTSRILAYRGAGEFIGEMSLLIQDNRRTADVVTLEDTRVLEIEHAAFVQLLQRSPSVVLAILRVLAARQRESDQKTITDLRQKYSELAEAYKKLQDKTNRWSEFLTTVAHELRTPLTAVKGYLALLRTGALKGEAMAQAIKTISANLDTITRLVNNILLLQEMALITPQFHLISISDLVNTVVDNTLNSGIPQNIALHSEIAAEVPPIHANPGGLRLALGALLDNAIKFSPDGGEILVRAYAQDDQVSVMVRDAGIGIAPDVLPHIFDHFHYDAMGTHLFGGIGLGLPLVKSVVEQHGGATHVQSEPGRGSTFILTFPTAHNTP